MRPDIALGAKPSGGAKGAVDGFPRQAHDAYPQLVRYAMRGLALTLVTVVAAGYAGPAIYENAGGQCEAVARRVAGGADMPPGARAMAIGVGSFIAARLVAEKYPQIPSSVSCAWVYWRLAWNPDGANDMFAGDSGRDTTAEELLRTTPQGRVTGNRLRD
jgi:hypothetical protein